MANSIRPSLGPLISSTCVEYVVSLVEEIAGRTPLLLAGLQFGHDVVAGLDLVGQVTDSTEICAWLDEALGANGARLCIVRQVMMKANGGYEVRLAETVCTSGRSSSTPVCAYTLGVITSAVQALTGQRMKGFETACQACGAVACVYQIDPVYIERQ